MILRLTLSLTLLLVCSLSGTAAFATLPAPIAQAAARAGVAESSIGLWVAPAVGGPPTIRHHDTQQRNPASVMKLLTSFAALDQLGPAWTWETHAYLQGTLHGGVLDGNVMIGGAGDPDLTWDRLGQWLRDWHSRGLNRINGDIVIDNTLFAPQTPETFDDAPQRAYNALPDAFLVNFGALTLRLTGDQAGQPVEVQPLTPASPLRIINRLHSSAGGCYGWHDTVNARFRPEGEGVALTLEGNYPASCKEKELNLKVDDPIRWAGMVIRAQWQEIGGIWQGHARPGKLPAATIEPFSTWTSPPLPEILRDMDKWSNNVMARQIFMSINHGNQLPLNKSNSIAWMQAWLTGKGLDASQWVLENGSGLSRVERTTPAQLGMLLQTAWHSPRMPEYAMALPVIGMDGTMRSHLKHTPVAGRGYVKTGTLDGVKSAAGYLLDASGKWQAFALIINDPRASAAGSLVDAVLQEVYSAGNS